MEVRVVTGLLGLALSACAATEPAGDLDAWLEDAAIAADDADDNDADLVDTNAEDAAPPACPPGMGDCNGDPSDGCETDLSAVTDCGGCGNTCTSALLGTLATCTAELTCGWICSNLAGDCNHDPSDGCETSLYGVTNCGGCGVVCPAPTAAHTHARCINPEVGCDPNLACDMGFGDCNADPTDGCEADLQYEPDNCGSCGHACLRGYACQHGACCTPSGAGCIGPSDTIPCCSGSCTSFTCGGTACGSAGSGCTSNAACCSGTCFSGSCCGSLGDYCNAESDCCRIGHTCYGHRCCRIFGSTCSSPSDCCSGVCLGGTCSS